MKFVHLDFSEKSNDHGGPYVPYAKYI